MHSPHARLFGPLLESVSDLVILVDPAGRVATFNRACEQLTGYRREEILQTELGRALAPRCGGAARCQDAQCESPWPTKSDGERFIRWRCSALPDSDGAPPYMLCIGTDVTQQRRLGEQLRAQSRLVESFFESTLSCAALLDREFNYLRVNLAFACACRRDIGEFGGRNLFELYPSDAKKVFEKVVRAKQPYEARAQPYKFPDHPERGVTYWDWSLVPVLDERGEVEILVFCLYDVTERERQAQHLVDAMKRMRVLSHQIAEAQERERRRIGLDLHDEVGQRLTAVRLALANAMAEGPAPIEAGLTRALKATDGLIEAVRRIALELRPPMLDDLGLLPALLWLFDRHLAQNGLRVAFKQGGLDRRLPSAVETAAYRIIQEALTNVTRHAHVREVGVLLRVMSEAVLLKVEDRGKGFEAGGALPEGGGSGLLGMRERARLLGGHVTIESAPGAGTAITAELPLEAPLDEAIP